MFCMGSFAATAWWVAVMVSTLQQEHCSCSWEMASSEWAATGAFTALEVISRIWMEILRGDAIPGYGEHR